MTGKCPFLQASLLFNTQKTGGASTHLFLFKIKKGKTCSIRYHEENEDEKKIFTSRACIMIRFSRGNEEKNTSLRALSFI